jgi:DNA invertase Pin-like site-specific DNA recombinase
MKSKAFAYLRVSGKGQIDGDGFPRQEKTIRAFSRGKFEIVETFKEKGISGTLKGRPALAEMIVSLDSNGHGIKTVIVERTDRIARDLMVQETILNDFRKIGISVISATEGDLIDNDPTRKLIRQIFGAIAEYDKALTVLKLRAARDRIKKRTGKKCEGRKSYQEVMPNVIHQVKTLSEKHWSSGKIAKSLNSQGLRSKSGKEFNDQIIRNIRHHHAGKTA